MPQALATVFAPLGSQFILLMLNSSIVSVISADDLTSATQDVAGRTFRSFEAFIRRDLHLSGAIAGLLRAVRLGIHRAAFARSQAR